MRGLLRHGGADDEHEMADLVRKLRKHRESGNDDKMGEYLDKIRGRTLEFVAALQRKKEALLAHAQLEGEGEKRSVSVLGALFVKLSRFLFYLRFLALALSEFSGVISSLCGFVDFDRLTLRDLKQHEVWRRLFGARLDCMLTEVRSARLTRFRLRQGLHCFCLRSAAFVRACYAADLTALTAKLAYCVCETLTKRALLEAVPVDDVIATFAKVLDAKTNLCLTLFKAMRRRTLFKDDDDEDELRYEEVLAEIIVCIASVEMQSRGAALDDDDEEDAQERDVDVDESVEAVLRRCDVLCIDESTKNMIRVFFASYFRAENEEYLLDVVHDVCSLKPNVTQNCCIQ